MFGQREQIQSPRGQRRRLTAARQIVDHGGAIHWLSESSPEERPEAIILPVGWVHKSSVV